MSWLSTQGARQALLATTKSSRAAGKARALPSTWSSWQPSSPSAPSTSQHRLVSTASPVVGMATPAFECLDAHEARGRRLMAQHAPPMQQQQQQQEDVSNTASTSSGPEPSYSFVTSGYQLFHHNEPLYLDYGRVLPELQLAYETWGTLNEAKDNAILIHTGLSASSHAKSHGENPARGWWEDFIGPGKALDTNRFFVICTNVLGSCYGSTGPSSPNPYDPERAPYGSRFPILSIFDMVRAQFLLLDHLGIDSLFASIGSSMGGMQSIAAAHLEPERVKRVVSISGCARSGPSSIALRFAQRSVLMSDPNWNRGHYYGPDRLPPHAGMKLARQIATITYRSGPEWEQRFGRRRRRAAPGSGQEPSSSELAPALCPDFEIESYIDHQGESFCLKYDANSLIYISKAMDLFDMSDDALEDLDDRRRKAHGQEVASIKPLAISTDPTSMEEALSPSPPRAGRRKHIRTLSSPSAHFYLPSLSRGLSRLADTPTLIIGAQSDILFPIDQQRELAECLRMAGNSQVRYSELDAPTGHDTFLIDEINVGGQIRGFLA
ncbi:homoserine acetyltransferase [Jaminaea rosea]|uniref:Homoserine acetyltransferase n=1 Tax=Jaminaea rosea TaxID=1569628 RepID=A0A316UYG9_9BASI|nr:homoserine acetyltransferase [Jaminaea rosea]PWN30356.1 homoserine acetyltransferase [Jaminaea rosea]